MITRYLRLYWALWKNSVVRELGFKTNFLLWIVVEMLWFGLQLSFAGVIYMHTDKIGDWTKWHVVLLMGASHFIQQTFQAFFFTNCTQLSELIRTGKMDFFLLLPLNTRFLVSLRQVDLGGFVSALSGGAVMIYALKQLNYIPSMPQIAGFLLLSAMGIVLHYSLLFLLASSSFWTVRAQGIVWGYYSMFNIARLPDAAFRGFFLFFFRFAVPMLIVVNVPVKLLSNRLNSWMEIFWLFVLTTVWFLISEIFWRISLRRYTSASS